MTGMRMTTDDVVRRLEEEGYKAGIVSMKRLGDLQEEIEERQRQGFLNERLYSMYFSQYEFHPPEGIKEANSIMIVAIPRPLFQVTFTWKGKTFPAIIPPTHLFMKETTAKVENLLAETLEKDDYHFVRTWLPNKLLAVRSGLARYGRNNIAYIPGFGSFFRLIAFFSDFPCPQDDWREVRMMEACKDCSACRLECPTGAISSERFPLRVERCITFHDELTDVPFPEWIGPSWHDSLMGCMHCQRACPINRDFIARMEEGPEFGEEETASFLKKVPLEKLSQSTVQKLEQIDLVRHYENIFPRNLEVFIRR